MDKTFYTITAFKKIDIPKDMTYEEWGEFLINYEDAYERCFGEYLTYAAFPNISSVEETLKSKFLDFNDKPYKYVIVEKHEFGICNFQKEQTVYELCDNTYYKKLEKNVLYNIGFGGFAFTG